MFGGATLFARADLALLDAGGPEDVVGRLLQLLARYEFTFAIVPGTWNAEPNAIAAIWEGSIAADLE